MRLDCSDRLVDFEDRHVIPLLDEIDVEAVREADRCVSMVPGDIVFLVNNADAYEQSGAVAYWQPLSVLYCDQDDRKGTVFTMWAAYDADARAGRLMQAEIDQIVRLRRDLDERVSWYNPLDGARLVRYGPDDDHDLLLRNAWYLFRGVVLPMLYHRSYRFVEPEERARFQGQVIHQITQAYRGLL